MLGRNGLMLSGEWRLLRRKREEAARLSLARWEGKKTLGW